jgi:hypothetical protein
LAGVGAAWIRKKRRNDAGCLGPWAYAPSFLLLLSLQLRVEAALAGAAVGGALEVRDQGCKDT